MRHHFVPPDPVDASPPARTAAAVVAFAVDRFLLLPCGVAVALVWANTAGESYFRLAHALRFAVNDIGMAFFVGLIAEEVLEAVMPGGALYRWRRTLLPVVAAVGGVVGATAAYLLYVRSKYEFMLLDGWPVAAALDLTFAYFVARAIFPGRRGPVAFLLLLAVASDALGLLSITIWYPTADRHPAALLLLAGAVLVAAWLRASRSNRIWLYLATGGALSWLACYAGGIPPALALVPIVPFLPHRPRGLDLFSEAQPTAPRRFEHVFRYPIQVVLLFFGFVNGGVVLAGEMPGAWAVLTAGLIGRPLGILASIALATTMGLRLPARLQWRELTVVSLIASAGFTFALLFATAIMPPGPLLGELKLGALATVIGGVVAVAAARLLHVGRFRTQRSRLGDRLEPQRT